jgi:hypothetical protein
MNLESEVIRADDSTAVPYFELDVVAMRGYQLFGCSCSIDSRKNILKNKLFEAFVRARQIGGDEARVGLVCHYPDPEALQEELYRDFDTGRQIRVFGSRDLRNLPDAFAHWLADQKR